MSVGHLNADAQIAYILIVTSESLCAMSFRRQS